MSSSPLNPYGSPGLGNVAESDREDYQPLNLKELFESTEAFLGVNVVQKIVERQFGMTKGLRGILPINTVELPTMSLPEIRVGIEMGREFEKITEQMRLATKDAKLVQDVVASNRFKIPMMDKSLASLMKWSFSVQGD